MDYYITKTGRKIPIERAILFDQAKQKIVDNPDHPGFDRLLEDIFDTKTDNSLSARIIRWMDRWAIYLVIGASVYFAIRIVAKALTLE